MSTPPGTILAAYNRPACAIKKNPVFQAFDTKEKRRTMCGPACASKASLLVSSSNAMSPSAQQSTALEATTCVSPASTDFTVSGAAYLHPRALAVANDHCTQL
jgi:hypothetical protein